MPVPQSQVVVAGHICLDIIPDLPRGDMASMMKPGTLTQVGPVTLSTGGAVANVGLALHRLGVSVRLVGKVGDDELGRTVRDMLTGHDPALADGLVVAPGQATSYTVVLSPPDTDRVFLHCPGANDTFAADDVSDDALAGARLLHFGYPPIMRRMFADGGQELAGLLSRARAAGLITSLDMAAVDPAGEAGRVDWPALLARVLPHVDLLLPSIDETLFMLGRTGAPVTGRLLTEVAGALLGMGAGAVALKLGDQGLYLRTGSAAGLGDRWSGCELLAPCFAVDVAGTTGSGDCTVAGFLAGVLLGLDPEQTVTAAVAAGACNCERPDATSGVPDWATLTGRTDAGWPRRNVDIDLTGWRHDESLGLYRGPGESQENHA